MSGGGQVAEAQDRVPCQDGQAGDYPCENVDLLSHLSIDDLNGGSATGLNDGWGWTDPETGTEYALVGLSNGVVFVDVSTPTEPAILGKLPTHSVGSSWRDVKVYENHAFVVSEARDHGMQVFDLTQFRGLSQEERPATFDAAAHYDEVERAHNIAINTDTGFAYIVGGNGEGTTCGGGLHMVDISTPTDPVFAGCFADPSTGGGSGYTHDAQCVIYQGPDADYEGGELCFNANETALNIAEVTDKDNPNTVANATYPQIGYVHQAWLTDDHRYLYVDDEFDELSHEAIDRTRTLIFDVTDLDNPELVTSYSGPTAASDHNQYIDGSYAYQANYQSGLRILDVATPESPVEVASFDTYPTANQPGFNGAWSTYPFFDRSFVLISSIGQGLFVVRPTLSPVRFISATFQEGVVRLEWELSSTVQTDYIEVEHQPPEEESWQAVETLSGQNGGDVQQYEYSLSDLQPGMHQFRVRHFSTDGEMHTSEAVSARVLPTEPYVATGPFPNPVQSQAQFKLTLREAQDLRVALYDEMGRRVSVLHDGPAERGVIHRYQIRARQWASGTYFLRVQGESVQMLRKVNVVR